MREIFACALTALVCTASPGVAAVPCDPYQQENDQVQQLSLSGNYAGAVKMARAALAHHPDDFRANYQLGWNLLAQSAGGKDMAAYDAGIRQTLLAQSMLGEQDMACVKAKSWYSLYATLGYYYYLHGDLANADRALGVARANFDKLDQLWQQRTLQYSAVLAFRKGDLEKAGLFSQRATVAGAVDAAKLNRAVQTIQGQ